MDANALEIILKLKEENIVLKKAILDAALMLSSRKKHLVIKYGFDDAYSDASWLIRQVYKILADINGEPRPVYNPDSEDEQSEENVVLQESYETKPKPYKSDNIV